jgi:hypothetical protein
MRHFIANFYRACKSKELAEDLRAVCLAYEERQFTRKYNRLYEMTNDGGKEFLRRHLDLRHKWARAFDEHGRRFGAMTSNMAECFNKVLKGIRALPVTAIAEYTFEKLNHYFLKYSEKTENELAEGHRFPKKVREYIEWQEEKSQTQRATCFDNQTWKYEVTESGGTTTSGEQYGGRAFKVMVHSTECSC